MMETAGREPVAPRAGLAEDRLVARARAGDADAFGQLYESHLDRIYRYVYYRVSNASEAEDLTEQVFLKAWEAIGRYESRGTPFVAWLFRLAHNLVVDHYRGRRPTEPIGDEPIPQLTLPDPAGIVEYLDEAEELRGALKQLGAEQQQVIVLRFVEGMSHAEVAGIVGKSEGAVRVIQHRALEALGRILRPGRRRA